MLEWLFLAQAAMALPLILLIAWHDRRKKPAG
jgi:hypothetical protein